MPQMKKVGRGIIFDKGSVFHRGAEYDVPNQGVGLSQLAANQVQMEAREIPAPLRMVVTAHLQATEEQLEQLVTFLKFLEEMNPLFKIDVLFVGKSWSVGWAFVCHERIAEALDGNDGLCVVGPLIGEVRFGPGSVAGISGKRRDSMASTSSVESGWGAEMERSDGDVVRMNGRRSWWKRGTGKKPRH